MKCISIFKNKRYSFKENNTTINVFHTLYYSYNMVEVIKSKIFIWLRQVARMAKELLTGMKTLGMSRFNLENSWIDSIQVRVHCRALSNVIYMQ